MKYALFGLALLTISCNREKLDDKSQPDLATVLNHYQLVEEHAQLSKLKPVLETQPLFSKIKNQLDLNKAQAFRSTATNSIVYIFRFKLEPDKKYAVHALSGEKINIVDEILYSRKMDDSNNGRIGILRNDEGISINFENGYRTISILNNEQYSVHFTREPFCQRKENQSFKDCYKQESDEFCDSFVSCVALATNPTISVLIAVACSCTPS